MKVCVIGSGGREHAIAWRLSISPSVEKVYAVPGSAAMKNCAELVGIDWCHTDHLIRFLTRQVRRAQRDAACRHPPEPYRHGRFQVRC